MSNCNPDYSKYELDEELLQDAVKKLAGLGDASIILKADWVKNNLAASSSESIDCVISNLNRMIENNPSLESYGLHFETVGGKVYIRK